MVIDRYSENGSKGLNAEKNEKNHKHKNPETIVNVPKYQFNNNSFLLKNYETKCGGMQTYQLVQPMQKQYVLDEITGLQKQKINFVTLKKISDGEN